MSHRQVREAIQRLEEGHPVRAHRHLRPLWEENSAAYVDSVGSLAYWMGRCFAEAQNNEQARMTWQGGMTALDQNGLFDPRLQDAYARLVARENMRTFYPSATEAYLKLFEQASAVVDSSGRAVVRRHVTQTAPLLPDSLRQKVLRKSSTGGYVAYRLRSGQGPRLAAWWRAQDPEPSTQRNERILEHLRRVQHAELEYDCDRCPAGYDDRGKVYVRLGSPGYRKDVNYPEPPISGWFDPPEHDIWIYPDHGASAIYPFVKRQGRYRLSGTQALIPKNFRFGYSKTRRGKNKTAVALNTMRSVYRELRYNSDYAQVYDDVLDWGNSDVRPQALVRSFLEQIEVSDNRTFTRRSETVPNHITTVNKDIRSIRTASRTARFLDSAGKTRMLLVWSHDPAALPDQAIVTAHAVHYDSTYRVRRRRQKTYTSMPDTIRAAGTVRKFPVEDIHGRDHVRLEWNVYPQSALTADGKLTLTERTRTSLARFDTLKALPSQLGRPLLSDVLPGRLRSATGETAGSDVVDAAPPGMTFTPYPFQRIRVDQPLALYFEVYNLSFGPDDRTRYTIDYELEQKKEGGLFRLFRTETAQTATTTEVRGASRRADEIIELDLDEAADADRIRITVRVTDEVTGRTAQRSLTFKVVE